MRNAISTAAASLAALAVGASAGAPAAAAGGGARFAPFVSDFGRAAGTGALVRTATTPTDAGLDWSAVGIGAGIGVGAAALLAGGAFAVRARRTPTGDVVTDVS